MRQGRPPSPIPVKPPPPGSCSKDDFPNKTPHIVVLGAGPAGDGAAFWLTRSGRARVTILEQRDLPGGGENAGSFDLGGIRVDYGSHRLHPSCDPEILADLRELLGEDLLDRPRHGRIRLLGRWIHFPLRPLDLALNLPPSFAFRAASDSLSRSSSLRYSKEENFADVLEQGLGRTFCREFYFPASSGAWSLMSSRRHRPGAGSRRIRRPSCWAGC